MKRVIKLFATLALLTGVFGVVAAQKEAVVAEAATPQTHRRVYVYLEGDWSTDKMFIHYWGGANGSTWTSCPEMTQVVNDYWTGLFYYDLAIGHTTFLVKNVTGSVAKSSDQSANIKVADLFVTGTTTNFKVAAVKAWVANTNNRVVGIAENAPGNNGQVAAILNKINSCSTSYAGGFNAWPQLNDLFISPSTLDGSTVVTDDFGNDTTIANKTAWLQAKYNQDQASPQRFIEVSKNNIIPVAIIGLFGVSSIIGYYFLKTKKFI